MTFTSSKEFVVIPLGTAVIVFAGQLFLRLISSKPLSAQISKHDKRMRPDGERHVAQGVFEVDSGTGQL